MIRLKIIFLLTVLLLSVRISISQPITLNELEMRFPFVKGDANIFVNCQQLNSLMERLYNLKSGGNGVISILHIGDSHLQADYLTSVIRTTLQKNFGNSGRGLIIPLSVAKTNEPTNYKSASSSFWINKRCIHPTQQLSIGVGGVTINTTDPKAWISLTAFNDLEMNYCFNKISLFCEKDGSAYQFVAADSLGRLVSMFEHDLNREYPYISSATLPVLTNGISIKVLKTNEQQSHATIYGLLLENGKPGIGYHTIGVNGAEYRHFTGAKYFALQTKALKPDLIIISLGTNEAYDYNFNQNRFYADIEQLYSQLKLQNPNAGFLFTTPACSFKRKRPNTKLPLAANTIIRFSVDNKLTYWDLQNVTGGANSAINWTKRNLIQPDGIHYNRAGYELQGNLFCLAFLNTYHSYVANRPK